MKKACNKNGVKVDFAAKYGQQVEETSNSSKYYHCYILKRHQVLNHRIQLGKRCHLENSQLAGGWGGGGGVVLVVALPGNESKKRDKL